MQYIIEFNKKETTQRARAEKALLMLLNIQKTLKTV
jgi:hypothetical protein